MKIVLALIILNFAASAFSSETDKNGFVRCLKVDDQTIFLDWDSFSGATPRTVSYFTIQSYIAATGHQINDCADWKYLREVPQEILKPVDEIKLQLPEKEILSIIQIQQGGNVYHSEKSAEEYVFNRTERFQSNRPEVLSQMRKEAGDYFANEVMKIFIPKAIGKSASCEHLVGSCDFYLCQENLNPCGLDGYNLGFGYKYCSGSKFKLFDEMTTEAGKQWVTQVFQCLQKKSLETSRSTNSCSVIASAAFDSHPDCYVQAGFCNLAAADKHKIFNLIKKEILSTQTISQGINIIRQCLGDK